MSSGNIYEMLTGVRSHTVEEVKSAVDTAVDSADSVRRQISADKSAIYGRRDRQQDRSAGVEISPVAEMLTNTLAQSVVGIDAVKPSSAGREQPVRHKQAERQVEASKDSPSVE